MPKKNKETEIAIVQEKISGMKGVVETTKITREQDLPVASDVIKKIKTLEKFIRTEKEKYTMPAKQIIKEANEKYDPYIKECQNAEAIIKSRVKEYMDLADERRKAEELKIANRVEKGTMKPETAVEKIEAMPEEKKTIKTENSSIKRSIKKVAVITHPELIPKEYWVIDEVRVRRDALAGKEIPGVEIKEESIISSI
jgi:hypothetical protein